MHREIDRLRAVTLGVKDVERSAAFYEQVWGLSRVQERAGAVFLRATGTDHHVLVLQPAARGQLVSVTFGTPDVPSLQRLYERLHVAGVPTEKPPRELPSPGGGWGFAFRDPEGRQFKVVADRSDWPQGRPEQGKPVRLAHVVLNTPDPDGMAHFFIEVLGFRLSDATAKMRFLRCARDHHAIAFARSQGSSLNHLAFEMASWNELMFGVGRVQESGHALQWGVGRHGPGDNVFAYFLDPDALPIEYTAEVQQIDDEQHVPGTPQQWQRPANRMDQWGIAQLSTDMAAAMDGQGPAMATLAAREQGA